MSEWLEQECASALLFTHPISTPSCSPVDVFDKNVCAGADVTRPIQQDCGRAGNHPRIDSDVWGPRMVYVVAN